MVSKAVEAEKQAKRLDQEGHRFPINVKLFLKSAEYSRKSAQYQQLAGKSASNPTLKALATVNYHIMSANECKSLANSFYYSSKPAKAASFFQKAVAQNVLAVSKIPLDIDDYYNYVQDSVEHITELEALIAVCNGDVGKLRENWSGALEYYRLAKQKWKELRSYDGTYARSARPAGRCGDRID